ncbi:MAG: hypothetical protein ACHQ6T_18165 [Myxococcota bacterium]
MRGAAARLLALLALVAVLGDANACLVALASAPSAGAPSELAYRAPCPCGCAQHAATLAGVGLSQPAAPQGVAALPAPERARPPLAPEARLPHAPAHSIDHVPIALA